MAEVLQDVGLAGEIKSLQKLGLIGNGLRDELSYIVSRRFKRLSSLSAISRF
jgi:hypothetical protein